MQTVVAFLKDDKRDIRRLCTHPTAFHLIIESSKIFFASFSSRHLSLHLTARGKFFLLRAAKWQALVHERRTARDTEREREAKKREGSADS
jgi:hypothetical protein